MRRSAVLFAVMLFAVSSFAQEKATSSPSPGSFRLSVFASDIGYTESSGNSNLNGDVGVSLEYQLRQKWSMELSYAFERHHDFVSVTRVLPDGTVFLDTRRTTRQTHPVDLVGLYRFENGTRWKPYIGAGARYGVARSPFLTQYSLRPELVGGVNFQFTDKLSLRLDARRELTGDADRIANGSVGIGWKF